MKTQDLFLVFGEKCQELEEAGHTPFFEYSGHVNYYRFNVYCDKWVVGKTAAFRLDSHEFKSMGTFLQACLNASNLLMLDPAQYR